MTTASKEQITKIHVLLSQQKIMDFKKEIVLNFSGGRTDSTKELTLQEARGLIQALSKEDPRTPMRNKIFALAYEAEIIWGDSLEDKKMNGIKLNQFLLERGAVKKDLSKMSYAELLKTVNQFQKIVQHQSESNAAKTTRNLLDELQIETAGKKHSNQH